MTEQSQISYIIFLASNPWHCFRRFYGTYATAMLTVSVLRTSEVRTYENEKIPLHRRSGRRYEQGCHVTMRFLTFSQLTS